MADGEGRRRGPGARPWILGVLALLVLALLALWLLDERADDRALEGAWRTPAHPAARAMS
ncbi:MAG TPA: hypothetical protein VNP72_07610 [Longimicrobium sp.]|nr:hypothetical protein [Longimicrobium sp.]